MILVYSYEQSLDAKVIEIFSWRFFYLLLPYQLIWTNLNCQQMHFLLIVCFSYFVKILMVFINEFWCLLLTVKINCLGILLKTILLHNPLIFSQSYFTLKTLEGFVNFLQSVFFFKWNVKLQGFSHLFYLLVLKPIRSLNDDPR